MRYPDTGLHIGLYIVASELKDPIWHSLEWQMGSFSSEATIYSRIWQLQGQCA